jgi:adenosylcobinamide-phosphate synthase
MLEFRHNGALRIDTVIPGCISGSALLVALILDMAFGEPAARWHPVVWIGRYLSWAGRRVAPHAGVERQARLAANRRIFWCAALYWAAGATVVVVIAWWLQVLLSHTSPAVAALALGCALKPLLSWRMLRDEVVAVESAIGESLPAGRIRLAWLVSRDVQALTESQVRESAIESLAENLNDSVVSPILWFAVAGLPGAALYRFANTADAMWGYTGERGGRNWQWAGKFAARVDDVLSWPGARIAAVLVAMLRPGRWLARLPSQARMTPSPNSGWPMAAFALALNIRLCKPGVYSLNCTAPEAVAQDVPKAIQLATTVIVMFLLVIEAVILGWHFS